MANCPVKRIIENLGVDIATAKNLVLGIRITDDQASLANTDMCSIASRVWDKT